jgi:peroxiredoxin
MRGGTHVRHTIGITLALLIAIAVTAATWANTPPIASFEIREAGDGLATSVILDASASSDPDGMLIAYQWIYGDGSTGSGVTTTHIFATASVYTVTLLVRDNAGASQLTSQTIDLTQPLPSSSTLVETSSIQVTVPSDIPVGYRVGERAPAFNLPSFAGDTVQLSDFLGHVVLLEFWSSACSACQAAMPHLEELRVEFADRGLVVITLTVNRNTSGEYQYLLKNGLGNFIALRESDPNGRPTMTAYNVSRIPHAVLIDQQGVIRYTGHLNLVQSDMIEDLL